MACNENPRKLLQGSSVPTEEIMKVGDLIYSEYWDTYAVFLGKGKWDGWIRVYLPDTQERKQVHDFIWELA